jgi:hypothetical protein
VGNNQVSLKVEPKLNADGVPKPANVVKDGQWALVWRLISAEINTQTNKYIEGYTRDGLKSLLDAQNALLPAGSSSLTIVKQTTTIKKTGESPVTLSSSPPYTTITSIITPLNEGNNIPPAFTSAIGNSGSVSFQLEYEPFIGSDGNSASGWTQTSIKSTVAAMTFPPRWIIRNGVNDNAPTAETNFKEFGKTTGTYNGNGAVAFEVAEDSDGDGLKDWWELKYKYNPVTENSGAIDTDNDGLTDLQEHTLYAAADGGKVEGPNPRNANTDGDSSGFTDGWEVMYGYDPLNSSDPVPTADDDSDGLTNYQEFTKGTHPKNANTDNDSSGFTDGWEVTYGYDPLSNTSPNPDGDDDSDGLKNKDEFTNGTNPKVADTDGDGFKDGWEVKYGYDPLDSSDPVSSADDDGDGLTNLQERDYGTDPTNPDTDGDGESDYIEVTNMQSEPDKWDPLNPNLPVKGHIGGTIQVGEGSGSSGTYNGGLNINAGTGGN